MALIGQKSEHSFVGVQCGIMDQFASVFGKQHQVIMLDCNSLEYQYFEANLEGYSWVLFDSCVKHTHLTSGYNDRRKDVDKGKNALWEKFGGRNFEGKWRCRCKNNERGFLADVVSILLKMTV